MDNGVEPIGRSSDAHLEMDNDGNHNTTTLLITEEVETIGENFHCDTFLHRSKNSSTFYTSTLLTFVTKYQHHSSLHGNNEIASLMGRTRRPEGLVRPTQGIKMQTPQVLDIS